VERVALVRVDVLRAPVLHVLDLDEGLVEELRDELLRGSSGS
jgi:hypothetical protein